MSTIDNNFEIRDDSSLYHSIDIIPWGTSAMNNPGKYLIQNWSKDLGKNPVRGEVNYIYVRAQNLSNAKDKTNIFLYAIPGGHLLDLPKNWLQIKAANGEDSVAVSADAHSKVVAPAAFCWDVPKNVSPNHHCFVAVASDSKDPLPKSAFKTNTGFDHWVRGNRGVAWRNIDLLPPNSSPTQQKRLPFVNLNSEATTFGFWVQLSDIDPDIEATITGQCAEEGPKPKINWKTTSHSYFFESTLPGHFRGILDIKVHLQNAAWPDGAEICTKYYEISDRDKASRSIKPGHMRRLGAFTIRG